MKILHVDTGKEWRGGQRQALLLHKGLLENGFESYLVANSKGELINKFDKNILPFDFKGEVNPLSILNLTKIINKIKPDIVHSHDAHSLTPLVIIKMLGKDFKLLHTRRVDFSIKKNIFSAIKYTNKYVDKVIAISEAVKNILINDGVDNSKIEVIYSGVEFKNPDDYNCPEDLKKILEGYFVIGCIANFADHKDHKTLIKAFDKAYEENKKIKLLLVGDGPLFNEVVDFAKTLPCFSNIIFTGFRDDVYSCLKCMDVFAMTSKEEGLCTSIIDALSFGIPVVATKVGGIPEIVKDGVNGYLAEVKNSSKIAELFLYSLDSKFNKNNLIYSVKEFSFEKMTFNYKKIYKRIMG
ncbi:MAG: glycosyl transferase [Deferribacteraceae bacterium]|jgi:glycosyltransferase involved in cell wall biosynthesis|nr:glycosyl transferase [Deferribacteraceae bacterium]